MNAEPYELMEWREKCKAAGYRFRCPVCGNIATPQDFKAIGADPEKAAQECIGRHMPDSRDAFGGKGVGPCNYAAYGLLRLGEFVTIDGEKVPVFPIAEMEGSDG